VTRIPFAIGIAAVALSITPALAADLGRFPPPARFYAPAPVVRVYNWTGCYLGAQLGGAFGNNQLNGQFTTTVAGITTSGGVDQNASSAAVLAGGQVGCDLQFARNWVIGAQIDGAWTNLNGSRGLMRSQTVGATQLNGTGTVTLKTDIIATATGRIGYAVNFDSIAGLFYLKGGAAFVDNNTSNFVGQITASPPAGPAVTPTNFSAPSANQWGWTFGLGTEWVLFENWSIFGEWDYLNFGTRNVTFTDPNNGSNQFTIKQNINELKLGINYRWNPLPEHP
jgi:outer membrane immunogenic protein